MLRPSELVVRVEKRDDLPTRVFVASVMEALDRVNIKSDVGETTAKEKFAYGDLAVRARNVLLGAIDMAAGHSSEHLCMHVATTVAHFSTSSDDMLGGSRVVIIGSIGSHSPLRLRILTEPDVPILVDVKKALATLETMVVAEVTQVEREIKSDHVAFEDQVSRAVSQGLFEITQKSLEHANLTLH